MYSYCDCRLSDCRLQRQPSVGKSKLKVTWTDIVKRRGNPHSVWVAGLPENIGRVLVKHEAKLWGNKWRGSRAMSLFGQPMSGV